MRDIFCLKYDYWYQFHYCMDSDQEKHLISGKKWIIGRFKEPYFRNFNPYANPPSRNIAHSFSCQTHFLRKDICTQKVSVAIPSVLWYMCVLQGGELMETKLLKELYDCFYTLPKYLAEQQEVVECHQALIKVLKKPERRLVLRIIDAKDHIIADTSIDSFISGFRLAWRLSTELNNYENERSASPQVGRPDARFNSEEVEAN